MVIIDSTKFQQLIEIFESFEEEKEKKEREKRGENDDDNNRHQRHHHRGVNSETMSRLHGWLKDNNMTVNSDVIVINGDSISTSTSNNNNNTATTTATTAGDNRGSPLLIACELDMSATCRALIVAGANVNKRHPSHHGNAPLLRCAEMGYNDCLRELLKPPLDEKDDDDTVSTNTINVLDCLTKEYKMVLGQNIPQCEAGGRSALFLAIEGGRIETVDILLRHKDGRDLVNVKDSFGRTALEASFEKLSMQNEGSDSQRRYEEICHRLCTFLGLNYKYAESTLKVSIDEAMSRERKRNVELRARYLKAFNEKKQNDIQQGLKAVKEFYVPLRKHKVVYQTAFPKEAMLLDRNALSDPLASFDNITEVIPGTFTFPLLTRAWCDMIYNELLHYEQVAKDRSDLHLPLHIRHDGNLGSLQECGFQPLLSAIEGVVQPLVRHFMPTKKGRCEVYHAFLTRNTIHREENTQFKIHCDKSDLTFNICLQASDDLEGSTVGFYRDPSTAAAEDVATTTAGEVGSVPTDADLVYTHTHQVGRAIIHDGRQWHKTNPILRGTRSSLIVWARFSGGRCDVCDATMGLTWLFCKQCGTPKNQRPPVENFDVTKPFSGLTAEDGIMIHILSFLPKRELASNRIVSTRFRRLCELTNEKLPRTRFKTGDDLSMAVRYYVADHLSYRHKVRWLYGHTINEWNVSDVESFSYTFHNLRNFNEPLSKWNTRNAKYMNHMFFRCSNFNQPLDNFDTSNVTDMSSMFEGATSFNQSVKFNTKRVLSMRSVFEKATLFDHPSVKYWNTSKVSDMMFMFRSATSFTQTLERWNTRSLRSMTGMFENASSFDHHIDNPNILTTWGWDLSKVRTIPTIMGPMALQISIFQNAGTNRRTRDEETNDQRTDEDDVEEQQI